MTELTVYLSPSSAQVSSAVEDVNIIALTLTVANNQTTVANLPTGLTIAFAVDPGDTGSTDGPTNALLFSNRTIDPEGSGAVQVQQVPTGTSSDPQWGIELDPNNADPTVVQFAVTPNGDGTIQPGASVTFAFSEVQVNMAWGTSTITVAVSPPGTDTIVASPQIQKTPVELLDPVFTVLPPRLTPPSNEVTLTWSNTGAYLCFLSWNPTTTLVTTHSGTTKTSGWSAPLQVTATAPVHATLFQGTGFTLHVQGGGLVGQPTDLWAPTAIEMSPPTLNAIAIPPAVSAINPPSGDPGGGQAVTITGAGFSETTAVTFTPDGAAGSGGAGSGGAAATNVIVNSDTELYATTPAGAGAVGVTVSTPVGTSLVTPASQYCYTAVGQPVVTGVSPAYGDVKGGDPVTIYGTGFTAPATVTFTPVGATEGSIVNGTVVSGTVLTATTPAGTGIGTVDITVTTSTTSLASLASQYTYIAAGTPFVTGVSPAYGILGGGQPVAITGTGLSQVSAVTFTPVGGGPGLSATSIANDLTTPDSLVTAVIPAGTGTVDVAVTTASTATLPGGTSPATPADLFSYAPGVTQVAPYQLFQLNWSSYTGSAPTLSWGSDGPAAVVTDPQILQPVTITTTSGILGTGAELPGIAGSAIAVIGRPSYVELAYFTQEASPQPARIDVTMAPLALTGFDISEPAVQSDGSQKVTLTWTAENATAFVLVNSAGTVNIPLLPHYQRLYLAELPLSGPSVFVITAYGYDSLGNPTSQALWQLVEPRPVEVTKFTWGNHRITNTANGQQTVTLSWVAANATGFTITGAGAPLSPPVGATSTDLNLPLPPSGQPGPTQFTVTITANGYVQPGVSNTASVDVYPFLLQPLSFTSTPTPPVITEGDTVTLGWSAGYAATGFTLDATWFHANSTGTSVSPKVSTQFTLTAQGYWPGPGLPTATISVTVYRKGKDDTDKVRLQEEPFVQSRLIPGSLLPEDAEPDPAEPAGPDGQPTGQQSFIGQDERPGAGAPPQTSRPADS